MKPGFTIDFPAIQSHLTDSEINELVFALRHARTLSMGPYLEQFEQEFAEYLGVRHAFGVSSASAALELAAMVTGIGEDDEVILPCHTFTATALPFMRKKAKLVFADIHPDTWVMDVNDVLRKITPKTKAIIPVHLYGLPVDMERLCAIADQKKITIIEDCAQALGASQNGRRVGTFGIAGCFSFHSQKNITTLGEGGMIVTNDDSIAEQILGLRKIGQRPYDKRLYYWLPAMTNVVEAVPGELPYNFALGEIQAFTGHLLLKRLETLNERRRTLRAAIIKSLAHHTEISFQAVPEGCISSGHLLPVRIDEESLNATRDDVISSLYEEWGVKAVIQYNPLYRYDLFNKNGYTPDGSCPESDRFYDSMISLPFSPDMNIREIDYLIYSVDNCFKNIKNRQLAMQA
jgi:dTDP-4-amino-4,6-dideoxygalactose transaminase